MNIPEDKLNLLLKDLKERFTISEEGLKDDTLYIKMANAEVHSAVSHLFNDHGMRHLSMMSYSDWPEGGIMELYYILFSYSSRVTVILCTELLRDNPSFPTMKHMFPQAETYEIEFNEMAGISFDGNDRMGEDFILEDWEGPPPMRRDFNTKKYVDENYMFRSGREDAVKVREEIRRLTGETGGLDD